MSKYVQNFVKNIFYFTLYFYAASVSAKLDVKTFKSVTSKFYGDTTHFSPTTGVPIIESGFMGNIRFYFVEQAFNNDGSRNYAKDRPLLDNDISDLVIKLFPSSAGLLSTTSEHKYNFGQRVSKPETIALLLNYVFALEQGKEVDRNSYIEKLVSSLNQDNFEELAQEEIKLLKSSFSSLVSQYRDNTQETLNKIKEEIVRHIDEVTSKKFSSALKHTVMGRKFLRLNKSDPQRRFSSSEMQLVNIIEQTAQTLKEEQKKALTKLISGIVFPIDKQLLEQNNNSMFFPPQIIQQILLGFFVQHFNTRNDIKDLLISLDDNIVDKDLLNSFDINDFISPSDSEEISNEKHIDMDDLLTVMIADFWDSPTPYPQNSALLSNGGSYPYVRRNNQIKKCKTFPDCAEMALRHTFNLLLYNKDDGRKWDFSHIIGQDNNPYFLSLKEFYALHPVSVANAGDLDTRSAWNKVVADLNGDDPHEVEIKYVGETNEIRGGLENIIYIYAKILGVSLEPSPCNDLESQKRWIIQSLSTIYKKINPNYSYSMSFEDDAGIINGVFGGGLKVEISSGRKKLFEFILFSKPGQTAIWNLISCSDKNQEQYNEKVMGTNNELFESFFLLQNIYKQKIKLPLYKLLGHGLNDDARKINFLKVLAELQQSTWKDNNLHFIDPVLKNILSTMQLKDPFTFEQSLPTLTNIFLHTEFSDTICQAFESILTNDTLAKNFVSYLMTIDESYLRKKEEFLNNLLPAIFMRKKLDSDDFIDYFEPLINLFNKKLFVELIQTIFSDVTKLNFHNYDKSINIDDLKLFRNLKKLKIRKCLSSQSLALKDFPELEELNLENLSNVSSIDFSSSEKIKTVKLNKINNLKMLIFNNMKNLNKIHLEGILKLENIELKDLNGLKEFYVKKCDSLKSVVLSEFFSLNSVFVSSCPDLEELKLQNLKNVKAIYLSELAVIPFNDLETLTTLQRLHIESCEGNQNEPENLNLENMAKLRRLSIQNFNIKELSGLKKASNLESLTLYDVNGLNKLDITGLDKLKKINISGCDSINDENDVEGLERLKQQGILQEIEINADQQEL